MSMDLDMHEDFAAQLKISRTLAKFMPVLQLQTDEGIRDSLILVSSNEFEMLRRPSRRKWTATTELQFLGAKMMMYGWSFRNQYHSDSGLSARLSTAEPNLSKVLILYEALGTATAYIHTFSEVGSAKSAVRYSSTSTDLPPQIYFPKYHLYTTYYMALFLYYFLSNLPQASLLDQDLARNHIRLAHTVLSRCGISNSEIEWARLAQNIELVGRFVHSGRRLSPEAQVKSRGGAALFYDAMFKIAVMKAEYGSRSFAADLTRGPIEANEPERTASGAIDSVKDVAPVSNISSSNDESGAFPAFMYPPIPTQQSQQSQQQYIPQEWDQDAFWGWDLSMMDTADFQIDWAGLEGWQP